MDPTPDPSEAPAGAEGTSPTPEHGGTPESADRPGADADTPSAPQPESASAPTSPSPAHSAPPQAGQEGPSPEHSSPTGSHPATGLRTGTTPRAVLRPVPEGFPTPPPRPARPNRRPALPGTEPEPPRRRGPLIAGLVMVAVLVLAVGIGGSVLAFRALTPSEEAPAASEPADPTDPADPADQGAGGGTSGGEVVLGEVTVREISTEPGVEAVGAPPSQIEPEGEFVILTLEVANGSGPAVTLSNWVTLETADGQMITPDDEAGNAHLVQTQTYGVVAEDSTQSVHAVFDVPIGAEPVAAHLDLASGASSGTGTLPLGG